MTRCIDDRRQQWPAIAAPTAACQYGCSAVQWWSNRDLRVGLAPAAQFDRSPWGAFVLCSRVFYCSAQVRSSSEVCRKCFMFHVHLDCDRSRRSTCGAIMPVIDRECFDFKRHHVACCCVCMQVNEAGHAQRLNMLTQRPRKLFFSRRSRFSVIVGVRSKLVWSYHNFTPDP